MVKKGWLILMALLIMLLGGCGMELFPFDLLSRITEEGPLPTLPPDDEDTPAAREMIPLDVLMSYPEYSAPQISADGQMILYRHISDYGDSFMVYDLQTGEQSAVNWPPEVMGVPHCIWAPDGDTVLFFVDNSGDENYGLYTTNIDTGETATLLEGGYFNCYYVSDNPANNKEIYICIFNDSTSLFDLYLLNYETGEGNLVLQNPGDITGYIFDNAGTLRAVTRTDAAAGSHVWLKRDPQKTNTVFVESEWQQIMSWAYEDADSSGAIGFMQDNTRLLCIDSSATNTSSLVTYNVETGETEQIFNDPHYDLAGTWTDIELDRVTAVATEGAYLQWHVLDPSFQDDYDALSTLGTFNIIDSSENDEYWIVSCISDVRENDYYLYEMATHELTWLYNAQPELEVYDFAPMEPFSYTASDGLTIEGYVTFPQDTPRTNLPAVVVVHGGPWSRDSWGYNSEVQLLANRGYLVIQVNFRGSTGYGKDFMKAGDREWGGLMHQDILDAVDYAVDMGWADPDRIGIYGASYGGYEALISAAFSSDVFQCAVDAFGPSSLLTFIESIPAMWSIEYQDLVRALGDPETEAEFMKSRSPLYFADQIEIPLLIAQGGNDVRVPLQESVQMVEALEEAGVPVTYLEFPNSGHGFNSIEDMTSFYSEMENFFAEHLGGQTGR